MNSRIFTTKEKTEIACPWCAGALEKHTSPINVVVFYCEICRQDYTEDYMNGWIEASKKYETRTSSVLRDVYQRHLNNRRPQSVDKYGLDTVFEERLLEITDERILDLVQLLTYEVLLLRDSNNRLSNQLLGIPERVCVVSRHVGPFKRKPDGSVNCDACGMDL